MTEMRVALCHVMSIIALAVMSTGTRCASLWRPPYTAYLHIQTDRQTVIPCYSAELIKCYHHNFVCNNCCTNTMYFL